MVSPSLILYSFTTAAFRSLKSPPLTTWPCLTEAFYLIGVKRGWNGRKKLLALLTTRAIRVHTPTDDELSRIGELMTQYKDTPMSFADASLVSLAEVTGAKGILTLDSDFHVYRINGKDPFDIIPLDA
jgi:hypothetical protein